MVVAEADALLSAGEEDALISDGENTERYLPCCFVVCRHLRGDNSSPELCHRKDCLYPPQFVSRFGEGGV